MRALKLFSLLLAFFAMPASAATYVGVGEGDYEYTFRDAWDTEGEYVISVEFDRPVTDLFVEVHAAIDFDESYHGPLYEVPTEYYAGPIPGAIARFSFAQPFPTGVTGYVYDFATIFFRSNDPVAFTITTTVIGTVPEPATWALFIIGFGTIGGTLRLRKRQIKKSLVYARA